MDDLFTLVYFGKFSYTEARLLPIAQRKYFLNKTLDTLEKLYGGKK